MRVHTRPGLLAALSLLVATALPGLAACSADAEAEVVTPAASPAKVRSALVDPYAGDRASRADTDAAECFADALLEQVTPEDLRDGGVLDAAYVPREEATALDEPVAVAWTESQLARWDDPAVAKMSVTQSECSARSVPRD